MNNNIKVSVCMTAYNHEDYIQKAIEGVLIQECDFDFEFVISDDKSTDGTADIIKGYLKNHDKGHCIKFFENEMNLGYVPNLTFAMEQCTGKYIAFLDSDDYWIDPLKLQKQVDFMDVNSEYSICFHNVTLIDEHEKVVSNSLLKEIPEDGYTQEQILLGGVMPTATVFFRNCLNPMPKSFQKIRINGDTYLFALLAQHGRAKYMGGINNSYRRIHETGIWSSLNEYNRLKNGTEAYITILETIKPFYRPVVAKVVYEKLGQLVSEHYSNKNYIKYIIDNLRKLVIKMKYKL